MIALRSAKITDALPQIVAKEPWAQAMAHAVNKQLAQIMAYADGVLVSANIDTMPDEILDVLAVELRLPYYDQTYTTEVKREIIKGAIPYWASAGTVASLETVLTSIFGDAEVEEWFKYAGDPGYFRILTTNQNVTGETLEKFNEAAEDVKRLSAWLEEVLVDMSLPNMNVYNGFFLYDYTETTLRQEDTT